MSMAYEPESVGALARLAGLSREALASFQAHYDLEQYSRALLTGDLGQDALRLVARSLPRKFALAWACDSVKQALRPDSPSFEMDRAGVALAETWLANPSEKHRRLALEFAERNDFGCAGAWIAAAVGWMEGSLAPEGYEEVAPPEHLVYDAVVAAQMMMAASEPESMAECLARFVAGAVPAGSGAPLDGGSPVAVRA